MNFIRSIWQEASFMEKVAMVGSLIYIPFPIDIIPDLLFGIIGIGFVDDIGALMLFLSTALRIRNRLSEKERQKTMPTLREAID